MKSLELNISELVTLDDQVAALELAFADADTLSAKKNSFSESLLQMAKARQAKGDSTPLTASQMESLKLQIKMNRRAASTKDIAAGVYGTVTVGEREKENSEMDALQEELLKKNISVEYIPAIVQKGNLIFDKPSELGWVKAENLPEGVTYIVEVKSQDDERIVTNLRASLPVEDAVYKKEGTASDIELPDLLGGDSMRSVRIPPVDPTFYIQPHLENLFSALIEAAKFTPQKLLISGPQGTGKTSIIQQIAARHNYNFFGMSCGMIESPNEWFGFRTIEGEEIKFVISAFIEACETPNTIILLDEFNRLHSSLQNGLYNILDDNGSAWIDLIKRNVRVASNVLFIATANIGMAHTGTFQIDAAMEDRFAYHLKMDYLPEADEIRVLMQKTGISTFHAEKLVRIGNKIREQARSGEELSKPVSFRQLEAAGKLMGGGMHPLEAIQYTILPKYSDEGDTDSEQATVLKICQGIFGTS